MNIQIAEVLNVSPNQIKSVREMAWVYCVVVVGQRATFVSKKKVEAKIMTAEIVRTTWEYGDNFALVVDGETLESWPTSQFTVQGFLKVFCGKHGIDQGSVIVLPGVDDSWKPFTQNHQSRLVELPPATRAYDPRTESNDLDPDEIYA